MKKMSLLLLLCLSLVLMLGSVVIAAEYVAVSGGKVVIDGNLSDWQTGGKFIVPAIVCNDKAQAVRGDTAWTDANDSSGLIYLRWTNDYLLLAADVTDDVGTLASRPDNGDSIGIDITIGKNATVLIEMTPYPPNGDWNQAVLARDAGPMTTYSANIYVRAIAKADGKGYYLEAALPWSELKVGDVSFNPLNSIPVTMFNVIVTDSDDGVARKSVLLNTRSASNPVTSWYRLLTQLIPIVFSGDGVGEVTW